MKLNNTKRLLTAVLLACASMAAWAQAALVVTTKTSGKVVYALSAKPVVTFTAADVVLTVDGTTVQYPLADFVQFTFSDEVNDPTGIEKLGDVLAVISCKGNDVDVSNAAAGTPVSVYTADGRLVQSAKTDGQGRAAIALDSKGTYVVKVGKAAMKVSF